MRGEHLTTIPESLDKRSPGVTNLIRRVHNDVVRGMAHVDHSFALRRCAAPITNDIVDFDERARLVEERAQVPLRLP